MLSLKRRASVLLAFLALHLLAADWQVDLAIIGGGPAGLTAGIYGARSGLQTLIIAGEEPGGQIMLSSCIENYPGATKHLSGAQLIQAMYTQAQSFGAKYLQANVQQVNFSYSPFTLTLSDGSQVVAKSVIVATGAKAQWLDVKNEKELRGYGVSSCAVCDGPFFRDEPVVVVGGGDSAFEEALYLTSFASHVTLIHRSQTFKASEYLQKKVFSNPKITVLTYAEVKEVFGNQVSGVSGVLVQRQDFSRSIIPCKALFVAIGHLPNTRLFENYLTLDAHGYIVTSPGKALTSVPGIFAAGDVSDPRYRQVVTAASAGCIAALEAYQYIKQKTSKESSL